MDITFIPIPKKDITIVTMGIDWKALRDAIQTEFNKQNEPTEIQIGIPNSKIEMKNAIKFKGYLIALLREKDISVKMRVDKNDNWFVIKQ